MEKLSSLIKRNTLAAFVAFVTLVFAIEALVTALLARDTTTLPFALVLIPMLVAVSLAAITEGKAGVKALLGKVTTWRVGPQWYAVVLGLPVLIALAVVGSDVLLGAPANDLFGKLTLDSLLIAAVVLLPALLEELGWRGYALPKLLKTQSALSASLIIGLFWTVCHLPLYLPGQMYSGVALWPLPICIVAMSVLLTWVSINTEGSVLMVTLLHAALNAVTPLTWGIDPEHAWELRTVVSAAVALLVIAATGASLAHKERDDAKGRSAIAPSPLSH